MKSRFGVGSRLSRLRSSIYLLVRESADGATSRAILVGLVGHLMLARNSRNPCYGATEERATCRLVVPIT
jgi:hypothetical protein